MDRKVGTGCSALDDILNGGIEKGVITNFYGASGTGKTNICVQAASASVKRGGKTIYVDTEGGFSAERFLQIHESREGLEDVFLMEPTTFKEQKQVFDRLEGVVEEEGASLLIVDSLVALYRIVLNDEVSESNRELSRQLSILSKIARKRDIPVLVTNQVYSSFESDEVQMVGRDVPTYWSKCLMKLETVGKNIRRAEIKKHRSRPEGIDTEFLIDNDGLQPADKAGVELL